MGANLTLNMEARLDEIDRIHAAVEILAAAEGWEPDLVFQIKLVIEEIGTNIVKYGYDDEGDSDIRITLTSESDALTMEIIDGGKPFDPFAEMPSPWKSSTAASRSSAAARPRLADPGSPHRRAGCLSRAKADGRIPIPARERQEQGDPDQASEAMTRWRSALAAPLIAAAAVLAPSC